MSQYPDFTTIQDINGTEIMVYSKKQREVLESRIANKGNNFVHVKVVKQFYDGDILLHLFFKNDNKLSGYSEIIGKRGGSKTCHSCSAYKDGNGEFKLGLIA